MEHSIISWKIWMKPLHHDINVMWETTIINHIFGNGNHTTYLWCFGKWFLALFYPHYCSTMSLL